MDKCVYNGGNVTIIPGEKIVNNSKICVGSMVCINVKANSLLGGNLTKDFSKIFKKSDWNMNKRIGLASIIWQWRVLWICRIKPFTFDHSSPYRFNMLFYYNKLFLSDPMPQNSSMDILMLQLYLYINLVDFPFLIPH